MTTTQLREAAEHALAQADDEIGRPDALSHELRIARARMHVERAHVFATLASATALEVIAERASA